MAVFSLRFCAGDVSRMPIFPRHDRLTGRLDAKQPADRVHYLPCNTGMRVSLAALKKWRAKCRIANESNAGSACEGPWQRRARLCVTVPFQCSPVLVRMAYFYCKGCAHLLTFLFFLLSFPEGDKLPERLSNLGIATRSTRLVCPPRLPTGSIRLVVQSTSQQR